MDAIHDALNKKQIILFEGACGTGKTLSALTPALYIAKQEKKTVVIATNMDQQMYQFIEEAKEIKRKKDIKVIVFKGKLKMCPRKVDYDKCSTLKENTYNLIKLEKEAEQLKEKIKEINKELEHNRDNNLIEIQKILSLEIEQTEKSITELSKNSCDELLELLKNDKGYFYDWVFDDVRTPEEVIDWASENNCCGYELLKMFIKEVDLLVCNYNQFINEELRSNVLDLLDKRLEDIILIFDEAHNIIDNARENSLKLTEMDLKKAIDEIYSKRSPLFCWDEVPGKDEDKFKKHINECFGINWVCLPKISKSDNRESINITDGNKTFKFELNTSNNEVKLVFDNLIYKYYTKKDENQLKIYRFPEPSKDFGAFLSVFKDTIRSKYIDPIRDEIIDSEWDNVQITKKVGDQKRIDTFKIELLNALEHHGIKNFEEIIDRMKNFGAMMDESFNKQTEEVKKHTKKRSKTSQIAEFLSNYMAFSDDIYYHPILSVNRKENEIVWRLELYSCIPKNITGPLFDGVHSAVLMSATLTPFEDIIMMLGIRREICELVYGTTFPKEKRRTIAVSLPALFHTNRAEPETENLLTRTLNDIIEQSDGNVLIFFPTYNDARKFKNRLNNNVTILLDEMGVSAQNLRNEFFKIGESGKKAVLLSYILGTLTEGVDYKDDRCRTVVIVGVGYPNTQNIRKKAVESTCKEVFGDGDGWKYAFTIPTIRKVRQALGRVIRSPEDYGVKVLLDMRYTSESVKTKEKYSVFNIFPEDERNEFVTVEPERVKYPIMEFFNNIRHLKNKSLLQEKERLQTEIDSLKQHIEDIEKYDIDLSAKLKIFEAQFDKIKHLSVIIGQKERKECLIREKEQLQIESEKFKQQKKHIESENAPYEVDIKIIEEEFNKIKKSIKRISEDIECARLYNANRKYLSAYPGIKENAKKRGFLGKSSSELQSIIEIKENELGPLKNTENQIRCSIEKEKDLLNKNSTQYLNCIEKISSNEKRINEIDSFLSSTESQCIKEIDENEIIALKNKKDEFISNIKKVRDSIAENNAQLFDFRNKKSLIDKRVNEINILLSSRDLQSVHI